MKSRLRQEALTKLKALSPDEKVIKDQQLAKAFLASSVYQQSQNLALFLAMPFEIDTDKIIEQALKDGKQVLVPKTFGQGKMIFVVYNPNQLTLSSFGVREPLSETAFPKHAIDLILVPGLVWNEEGYRIGFGGGYYDRYLADFKGQTVSLCYAFQLQAFEAESHDLPVQEVIYELDIC
ncbi:5-formyltetrahydrofolate cyclo-ligase [Streptococcus moroccensis]|uniref:5-formyltetrahydrofolate cyclo-ligase n=1 Tax=Streptococcus moroccensis TaxID=1451356 RepID=A0ABT9YR28_9STRE|nr:5-formyltetrahydrofolate cyclo-ligase [Streptococcus moroccensis]MDQ0222052.1 5-formyltetrahydrofolate cyclo-ligase [Streptococcus moroccensis]